MGIRGHPLWPTSRQCRNFLERATRIELAFSAWEADVLPLNYARVGLIVLRPHFDALWERSVSPLTAKTTLAILPHRNINCSRGPWV
jgi:hypothetical protein